MTLTRFFDGRILHRLMSLLMIVSIICVTLVWPPMEAHAAFVLDDAVFVLIGLALIACGVTFTTTQDMQQAAQHTANSLPADILHLIQTKVLLPGQLLEFPGAAWNQLCTTIEMLFGSASTAVDTHHLYDPVPAFTSTHFTTLHEPTFSGYRVFELGRGELRSFSASGYSFVFSHSSVDNKYSAVMQFSDGCTLTFGPTSYTLTGSNKVGLYIIPYAQDDGSMALYIGMAFYSAASGSWNDYISGFTNTILVSGTGIQGHTGSLTFADSKYYVDGHEIQGITSGGVNRRDRLFYSLAYNSATLTYGVDRTLVPDLPYVETGDVAVSIPHTLDAVRTMNPAQVISQTISIPRPHDMPNIDLPGHIFMNKFPFCLPFDVYNAFASLVVQPEAPSFTIPLPFSRVGLQDEEITVDFSQFQLLSTISRWGFSIIFIIALILITRKIIGAQ